PSRHASGPHMPAQCRLVTSPATSAAPGVLMDANSTPNTRYRAFAGLGTWCSSGTVATGFLIAMVNIVTQAAIISPKTTATTSHMLGPPASAGFRSFESTFMFVLPQQRRVRPDKFDLLVQGVAARVVLDPDREVKLSVIAGARHLQHQRHDILAQRLQHDRPLEAGALQVGGCAVEVEDETLFGIEFVHQADQELVPNRLGADVVRRAGHARDTEAGRPNA